MAAIRSVTADLERYAHWACLVMSPNDPELVLTMFRPRKITPEDRNGETVTIVTPPVAILSLRDGLASKHAALNMCISSIDLKTNCEVVQI